MRAAIDCRYIRERPSGIGAYVRALVERLPALAPADSFVFWSHALAHRPLSAARNASDKIVRAEPNSLWTLMWLERFATLAGTDVFHAAHNVLPARVTIPTVVTIHDLLSLEHPGLHRSGLDGLIKQMYYPRAVWRALELGTRLITTTTAMADRVIALCPTARARCVVVPLGVDEDFTPAADCALVRAHVEALVGAAPYFLVVGQNSAVKRHATALAAFAAGAPAPWRLVFVQRQHRSGDLARLLDAELASRVVWLPEVSRADLVALVQCAGALLQPSTYEGFGLPVVEAMRCGCPVVASDIATLREVVGGGGMLVPPGDASAWAAAVRELATVPVSRAEWAARALDRSRAFSWDRCARSTLDVYRDAIARFR